MTSSFSSEVGGPPAPAPSTFLELLRRRLAVSPRTLALYLGLYLPVGMFMNALGGWAGIAEFVYDWQVLTTYGLYLVPVSLWVRHRPWFDQYLHGLLLVGLLELGGYALGTSIVHAGNLVAAIFSPHNFALVMVLWFAVYLPAGNWAVARLERRLFR